MRKIVATTFISLDGVMEDPQWSSPYWGDDIAKYKFDELFRSDAMLLGRVTYEGFAQAWPDRTDEQGYADRFNSMPKYVVSTTLQKADWTNSHIISTNVADEIMQLKQMDGQDITVHGSCTLVQYLLEHGLVDELKLLVYPIAVGKGKRLFKDGNQVKLILVETNPFASGAVAMIYQPEAIK